MMKTFGQYLLVTLMLLIGMFAFFWLLGQFVLFLENNVNPFLFASAMVGIIIYVTLNIMFGGDHAA